VRGVARRYLLVRVWRCIDRIARQDARGKGAVVRGSAAEETEGREHGCRCQMQ
jgi:hypothetical protein